MKDLIYIILLFSNSNLKSIRDLDKSNIEDIIEANKIGIDEIARYLNVDKNSLVSYFHHPPSFYRLHIHISNCDQVSFSLMWSRTHILENVVQNVEMLPDYYKKIVLYYNTKFLNKQYN